MLHYGGSREREISGAPARFYFFLFGCLARRTKPAPNASRLTGRKSSGRNPATDMPPTRRGFGLFSLLTLESKHGYGVLSIHALTRNRAEVHAAN